MLRKVTSWRMGFPGLLGISGLNVTRSLSGAIHIHIARAHVERSYSKHDIVQHCHD